MTNPVFFKIIGDVFRNRLGRNARFDSLIVCFSLQGGFLSVLEGISYSRDKNLNNFEKVLSDQMT